MNAELLIIKGLISELPEQEQAKIADAMSELRQWVDKHQDYASICLALAVAEITGE